MGSYEVIRCWCLKFGRPTLEICGEIMPGVGLEPQSPIGRITPLPESEIEGPHWRSIGRFADYTAI